MHLVDDGLRRWTSERHIALPVVCRRVQYNAFHCRCSVVPMSTCCVPVVCFGDRDSMPVRIEQNFFGVETHTSGRIKRSMESIPIELSRANAGHKHMPIVIGAIGNGIDSDDIGRLCIVLPIEEKNLNSGSFTGKYAEVYSVARNDGAER